MTEPAQKVEVGPELGRQLRRAAVSRLLEIAKHDDTPDLTRATVYTAAALLCEDVTAAEAECVAALLAAIPEDPT